MDQQIATATNDATAVRDFFESKWYVLFVRSNQEKRVALGLRERGVEHLLPCYSSLRQWKDRKVRLEMPLFPGYIFVHIPLAERLRTLTVPHVLTLVGKKGEPAVVSAQEIAWIRTGVVQASIAPHDHLEAGQRVMITDGVLQGMQGILLRKCNAMWVVVSLESIARAFVVEVEAANVRVVGAAA